jgi:hypothetical protein
MIILIEGAIWFAKRYEKDEVPAARSFLRVKSGPITCAYCGGKLDQGGIFCGLCGKASV